MKTTLNPRPWLAMLAGLLLMLPGYSQQQAPKRQYSEVYFHKLRPGHTMQEAIAMENEWKKIHQVQIDNGHITAWYMLIKGITSNPNQREYDYITVKNFTDFGILDNAYPQSYTDKAFGNGAKEKWADLGKRTNEIQEHGKMEIWESVDVAWTDKALSPDKFPIWIVDLMRVKDGKYAEYVAMEKDMKKLHQERIKMNNIVGWNLLSLKYPAGTENGYEYATVNFYPNSKEMGDGRYPEAFQKAMPGQDAKQLTDRIYQTRDMVRQEVYILREFAVKQPPIASR